MRLVFITAICAMVLIGGILRQADAQSQRTDLQGWSVTIGNAKKSNSLNPRPSGGTYMIYSPQFHGADYFIIVPLKLEKGRDAGDLIFTRESTYLQDAAGAKSKMYGTVDKDGFYEDGVIKTTYTKSLDAKLVFCVSGEANQYQLVLAEGIAPIAVSVEAGNAHK